MIIKGIIEYDLDKELIPEIQMEICSRNLYKVMLNSWKLIKKKNF